jgi:hypothetical protein
MVHRHPPMMDQIARALHAFVESRAADSAKKPVVVAASCSLELDDAGDPTLMVRLALAKNTTDGEWTNKLLLPLADEIRNMLAEQTGQSWVHVSFERSSRNTLAKGVRGGLRKLGEKP